MSPYARRTESKYRAKPVVIDNIRFASQKEGRRYAELKLLEKAGKIHGLTLQPEYPLSAATDDPEAPKQVGKYRADFAYWDHTGTSVVEDVKGFKTPLYRWKKKHMAAQYGIEIREI